MLKVMFGNLLHAYARDNGDTLADVAKRAGISSTYLSKWKGGRWDSIPEDVLTRVIEAATKDPVDRGRLVVAYLLDITPARYRGLIDVSLIADKEDSAAAVKARGIGAQLEQVAEAYPRNDDFKRMADTLFGWARRINETKG